MEKKTLAITIPEGKKPKMSAGDHRCIIDWVPAEKTFEDYVREFSDYLESLRIYGVNDPYKWLRLFKFGLLQFIADDMNEEKIDWGSRSQRKYCVCYDYSNDTIMCDSWRDFGCAGYVFTEEAAKKAIKIIPSEFLKTF